MNIIIKVILVGILSIALQKEMRAEPSSSANSKKISSLIVNQRAKNLSTSNAPERLSFVVTAHQREISVSQQGLDKQGFMSARFKLSRLKHNENLESFDSDTSNEHVQASMVISLEEIPNIENYLKFFTHPGYFTIAK